MKNLGVAKSFTLIELLVVIAIIAILAAMEITLSTQNQKLASRQKTAGIGSSNNHGWQWGVF